MAAKVEVFDVSRNALNLRWTAPPDDGGSPIKGYMIEKRTTYSPRWTKVNRTPIKDTTLLYTDLPEGEEYQFRVFAVNEAGYGPPSQVTPVVKLKDPFGEYCRQSGSGAVYSYRT